MINSCVCLYIYMYANLVDTCSVHIDLKINKAFPNYIFCEKNRNFL